MNRSQVAAVLSSVFIVRFVQSPIWISPSGDTASVRFLPTEAFGKAVQEAVHSARSRIWILAYYISGGSHETIQAIMTPFAKRLGPD